MFKKIYCELRIKVKIQPVDALLIKSGTATVSGPDASFVKTYRNGKATPFLPGSSLKGIMRSHAEKIIRTISQKNESCCLPYESKDKNLMSCGDRFKLVENKDPKNKVKVSGYDVYKSACPACKMFGSTHAKGHFSVSDAYTNDDVNPELRDGVAIDRMTGGAARGAKFDMEVINKGNFEAEIHLRNFESWQLGLLGFIFKDINDGILRLGSGTSRGLGRISINIEDFKAIYYIKDLTTFDDVAELCTDDELMNYGFYKTSNTPKIKTENIEKSFFRSIVTLKTKEEHDDIFEWGAKNLGLFLPSFDWKETISKVSGK